MRPLQTFPTAAQDRQARGHPPFSHLSSRQSALSSKPPPRNSAIADESAQVMDSFAEMQRVKEAARVLDSWDMLGGLAVGASESIPQTRLRYQKQLIGLKDTTPNEWEDAVDEKWWDSETSTSSRPAGKAAKEERSGKAGSSGTGMVRGAGKDKDAGKGDRAAKKSPGKQDKKNRGQGRENEGTGGSGSGSASGGGTFGRLRREREEERRRGR